ncbi:MAG TPA: LytTR family DNA-binding domain-containing protein [Longimicrobiales bacterium]|nr:LytTR family DNA-binding domain-containing protein [Longimicrobiales bacterium]
MVERRGLRVLVVDDEPLGRRRILDLLEDEDDIEAVATAADGIAAVEAIQRSRPDVVFLDVQMPGMSGLEVVRHLGAVEMPAIVFITAYDEYAIQAFDAAAADYLVKPFRNERFREALGRVRRRIQAETRGALLDRLLAVIRDETTLELPTTPGRAARYLERIAVPMRGRVRVVPVSEIDYITALGTYAALHVGRDRYVLRESLQHLEEQLDPDAFVRIHRSTIVRVDRVEALLRGGGSYEVQLKGGIRLRVGRTRRAHLERLLGRAR